MNFLLGPEFPRGERDFSGTDQSKSEPYADRVSYVSEAEHDAREQAAAAAERRRKTKKWATTGIVAGVVPLALYGAIDQGIQSAAKREQARIEEANRPHLQKIAAKKADKQKQDDAVLRDLLRTPAVEPAPEALIKPPPAAKRKKNHRPYQLRHSSKQH